MTPKSKKAKARRLQDWIVGQLRSFFTTWSGAIILEDDIQPAIMGQSGVDVRLSPLMQQHFPFAIEAKNQETINVWNAYEQARTNAGDLMPLLVFKRNRSEPMVLMTFDNFFQIWKEYKELEDLVEARHKT